MASQYASQKDLLALSEDMVDEELDRLEER
jgi:hypothetical protein